MLARTAAVSALMLLTTVTNGADPAPVVEPTGMWSGKLSDQALRELAPKSSFIADEDTWKALWTAWRPGEEVPKIDLTREVILVGTVPGPNLIIMRPTLDKQGAVKFIVGGTRIGGPGFGYKLISMSRDGVKTINGTAVEAGGVRGILIIPETVESFEERTLELKLWEYDPLLADVSAKLVDESVVAEYDHRKGNVTKTSFALGTKLEPRQDRHYYITAFVLKDGQRTLIGEKDGKSGLCKVLTDGNPASVKLIARPIR